MVCRAAGLRACLACSWVMQCVDCVLRRLVEAACSGARLPMRPCCVTPCATCHCEMAAHAYLQPAAGSVLVGGQLTFVLAQSVLLTACSEDAVHDVLLCQPLRHLPLQDGCPRIPAPASMVRPQCRSACIACLSEKRCS